MNKLSILTNAKNQTIALLVLLVVVSVFGFASITNAASYAYVDVVGEVKSVTADNWQSAIATAANIHSHSGVMLLSTASDFDMVGNDVSGY